MNYENEIITLGFFYNIKIVHAKNMLLTENFIKKPHSHSHCEIFIHVNGEMEIFVEKNFYRISAGSVRLYASGEFHFGKLEKNVSNEWYQISVPKEFFEDKTYESLGKAFFERRFGERNVFFPLQYEEMKDLAEEIFAAHQIDNVFFEPICKGNILRVLYLANKGSVDSQKAMFFGSSALTDILEIINRNSAKISSVDDICRMTNYSASYINELFKKSMNITPYKFVISKKLNQAKIALDLGMSVSSAAEFAGFNNYSNFISIFGKTFGVSPKRYQKNGCKQIQN